MNYSNLNIHKRIKSVIVVQHFVQNTLNCVLFLVYFATYVGLRSVEMVKTEELEWIWNKAAVAYSRQFPTTNSAFSKGTEENHKNLSDIKHTRNYEWTQPYNLLTSLFATCSC